MIRLKQANSLADAAGYFSKVSAIGLTPAAIGWHRFAIEIQEQLTAKERLHPLVSAPPLTVDGLPRRLLDSLALLAAVL